MKCSFVDENFEKYLEGEFTRNEERELAAHIKSCERCRKKYYDDFLLKNILNNIEDEPIPKGLANKTYDYIFGSKIADNVAEFKPKNKKKDFIHAITGGIAAAAIIMAIIISPNVISGAGESFISSLEFESSAQSNSAAESAPESEIIFDAADEGQSTEGTLEDSADVDLAESEDSTAAPQAMDESDSCSDRELEDSWYIGYDINVTSDSVELCIYDEDMASSLENAISSHGITISEEDGIYTAKCGDGETVRSILMEAGIVENTGEATKILYSKDY